MKKELKKFFTIRMRMDLRDNSPMIAIYFGKWLIHATKYDALRTQMFYEISEDDYFNN